MIFSLRTGLESVIACVYGTRLRWSALRSIKITKQSMCKCAFFFLCTLILIIFFWKTSLGREFQSLKMLIKRQVFKLKFLYWKSNWRQKHSFNFSGLSLMWFMPLMLDKIQECKSVVLEMDLRLIDCNICVVYLVTWSSAGGWDLDGKFLDWSVYTVYTVYNGRVHLLSLIPDCNFLHPNEFAIWTPLNNTWIYVNWILRRYFNLVLG